MREAFASNIMCIMVKCNRRPEKFDRAAWWMADLPAISEQRLPPAGVKHLILPSQLLFRKHPIEIISEYLDLGGILLQIARLR